MRDWTWTLFIIVWSIYALLDVVEFSIQMGDKNQVTIEKVQKKEPQKETNDIKTDW